eukprot:gene6722-7430_t
MIYWSLFALSLFCIALSLRIPWRPIAASHCKQGPLHLSSQDQPLAQDFADFKDLPDWLLSSCNKLGYTKPTLVQANSLPVVFRGVDVIIQAQTGSGKTLAFALPILSKIDPNHAAIQAVVVTPTRELGQQVTAVLKQLASGSPQKIMIMPVVEGSKNRRQQLWATAEPPHVVVGNPRALQRLVDMGRLRLNSVNFVVVDEVDACLGSPTSKQELHNLLSKHLSNTYLDADTIEELEPTFRESRVNRNLARDVRTAEQYRNNRQTIMCSATIPQRKYFADSCYRNGWTEAVPEVVQLSDIHLLPQHVRHEYIPCDLALRPAILMYLLRKELFDPSEDSNEDVSTRQCIVFVDYVDQVEAYKLSIEKLLSKASSPAQSTGRLQSSQSTNDANEVCVLLDDDNIDSRREAMDAFRQGRSRVLLCSDLAARGLDIPNTSLVIQMCLPKTAADYVHRAGRTGRLDRHGRVISMVNDDQDFVLKRYQNELGIVIHRRELKQK